MNFITIAFYWMFFTTVLYEAAEIGGGIFEVAEVALLVIYSFAIGLKIGKGDE